MCILCSIQKWSRGVATMLPWLVIPLIGLWALSQLFPPAFRFEITSPRLACVIVLVVTLGWYEVLMPKLSAWRARRNASLRERKRFEAIEMQKLRKTATRRCRNCLTPYRDQNPGGGKFMCSYCGHISKRPILDLPVPPGLGLSNSGILRDLVGKGGKMLNGKAWSDNRWMCGQDWLENGNWVGGSFVSKSDSWSKTGGGFLGVEHCIAEKSYSRVFAFACKALTAFFLSIMWLCRKVLRISSSRSDASMDAERRAMMDKRGENGGNCQESRGEKSRRKAEEKRLARLEKELAEEEERKQREEVARLVEERRKLRDEKMEAEKERGKGSPSAKVRDSKREAEKKRQEKKKERDRGSSKSNSDVEELDKRQGKESVRNRQSDGDRRHQHKNGPESVKTHNAEVIHGFKGGSSSSHNHGNVGTRYLDRMRGTFLSSSRAFTGGGFFGKSNATNIPREQKSNTTIDPVHNASRRELSQSDRIPGKLNPSGDDRSMNRPVLIDSQPFTAPKKSWQQLFTRSSTVSPPSSNVISRPSVKPQPEILSPSCQTPAVQSFDNPISFGLPSPFTLTTFPCGPASCSTTIPSSPRAIHPRIGDGTCQLFAEELENFEDPCYVPDPVSLLGPVCESLSASASRAAANGSSMCVARLAFLGLFHAFAPVVSALPMPFGHVLRTFRDADEDLPKDSSDPQLWLFLGVAVALVLAGGVFAGLTIALMGQDEIYLQVLASSGEKHERKNAKRVLKLLERGKHWVLVTLLLSNVITNETLPIVLDRSLGGGWPAVVSSTVLIVIFGEVVPQSICVRYGLPIGAAMAPIVLGLMYIMGIIAWPTAKLLDYLLGEDHGTVYKKGGLKTLVSLHQSLGLEHERLNEDEVTIITAVLDLKAKAVGNIMTPMKDVFTMSSDTILDEKMMDNILSAGYSRIPIHTPENENNFVGMLLVKMLITYDPEDALRVRDFALATLPETRPETSCLDILNFFQEGKSHMVLVSEFPAEARGAVGVVTLEDVIEELIGEEIIDESDVFIDVHKAIRRMAPAPRARVPRGKVVTDISRKPSEALAVDTASDSEPNGKTALRKTSLPEMPDGHPKPSFLLRRRSSGSKGGVSPLRTDDPTIIQHLKHLGPSNVAARPKQTRINTVKIKPGQTNQTPDIPKTIPEDAQAPTEATQTKGVITQDSHAPEGGIGEGLLASAGREASDGVHSVAVGYGTMAPSGDRMSWKSGRSGTREHEEPMSPKGSANGNDENTHLLVDNRNKENGSSRGRSHSVSTIASLRSLRSRSPSPLKKRHTARSGSISENVVDFNGIKKVVLETTSSSDSEDKAGGSQADGHDDQKHSEAESSHAGGKGSSKKKRKKRGKKKKGGAGDSSESQPLLGDR